MSQILIVDDEESICWTLNRLLTSEGHKVGVAASAEEAFAAVAERRPDVIILDVRLPGMDGLTAMSELQRATSGAPIVIITAFGNLATAIAAVKNGAFDYLTKPFDLDQVSAVVRRALASFARSNDVRAIISETSNDDELIGSSPAMQEVFKRIALVADSDASVLITGESGTGKELVARAIHRHSRRSGAPLIPINLAALSENLVESELFGHARGAFTGATDVRQGLLELAHAGTAFFDEAGDIPLNVQVKLLRVLEQHELTPVGDSRAKPADFRVIAATNRDLRAECRAGRFREDLFFRLAVFEIQLPPLRERGKDIPVLAQRFLERLAVNGNQPRLLPDALEELYRRPWPGNVRELRNAVEHGALLARGGAIGPEHLPPMQAFGPSHEQTLASAVSVWARNQLATNNQPQDLYRQFLDQTEPALFDAVLERTNQNRMAAAELLGIHRATLRKKLN
jgi:two-component system nitrogen regulation response regulator GlnG